MLVFIIHKQDSNYSDKRFIAAVKTGKRQIHYDRLLTDVSRPLCPSELLLTIQDHSKSCVFSIIN